MQRFTVAVALVADHTRRHRRGHGFRFAFEGATVVVNSSSSVEAAISCDGSSATGRVRTCSGDIPSRRHAPDDRPVIERHGRLVCWSTTPA